MSFHSPFWFVSEELLTGLLRHEIHLLAQLFGKHPDLPKFFDLPEAAASQRTACFELLAHCALRDTIYETFAQRWEQSPSLGDEEKDVLQRTRKLFAADAPAWVLELNEVAGLLPSRVYDALPGPLRVGGYNPDSAEEMQAIESAKRTLSNVEQIQALNQRVMDEQLQRLAGRWLAEPQIRKPKKGKVRRRPDELRMLRDKAIAEIADVSETITEYLKLMDERKVKPQPTWSGWPGSWREAYKIPRLRELIHKDKSRALARVRNKHNR